MNKFKVNQEYSCRSLCDHNCVWTFKILKRTLKTITFYEPMDKETKTKRVNKDHEGHEIVYPLGRYSMAPMLRA